MPTNAPKPPIPARAFPSGRVINVLRKSVSFDSPLALTGIPFENSLPIGARITDVVARKFTGFTAGTTVNVGTTPGGSDVMPTADFAPATVGASRSLAGVALAAPTVDTMLYITLGGTAATAGSAEVDVMFEVAF